MSSAATCPSRLQSRARGEESPSSPASTPHATCCDLLTPSVCGRPAGCQDEDKTGVDRGSASSTRRPKTIQMTGRRCPWPLCRHTHVGPSVVYCKFSAIWIVVISFDRISFFEKLFGKNGGPPIGATEDPRLAKNTTTSGLPTLRCNVAHGLLRSPPAEPPADCPQRQL